MTPTWTIIEAGAWTIIEAGDARFAGHGQIPLLTL